MTRLAQTSRGHTLPLGPDEEKPQDSGVKSLYVAVSLWYRSLATETGLYDYKAGFGFREVTSGLTLGFPCHDQKSLLTGVDCHANFCCCFMASHLEEVEFKITDQLTKKSPTYQLISSSSKIQWTGLQIAKGFLRKARVF